MSDIEKKLYEIVANQQKIIAALVKRAQTAPAHRDEVTHDLGGGDHVPTTGHQAPAQSAAPNKAAPSTGLLGGEADLILKSLPPLVRSALKDLKTRGNTVLVKFQPGKGSDAAFNAIQSVVTALQQRNVLKGTNYQIQEVA